MAHTSFSGSELGFNSSKNTSLALQATSNGTIHFTTDGDIVVNKHIYGLRLINKVTKAVALSAGCQDGKEVHFTTDGYIVYDGNVYSVKPSELSALKTELTNLINGKIADDEDLIAGLRTDLTELQGTVEDDAEVKAQALNDLNTRLHSLQVYVNEDLTTIPIEVDDAQIFVDLDGHPLNLVRLDDPNDAHCLLFYIGYGYQEFHYYLYTNVNDTHWAFTAQYTTSNAPAWIKQAVNDDEDAIIYCDGIIEKNGTLPVGAKNRTYLKYNNSNPDGVLNTIIKYDGSGQTTSSTCVSGKIYNVSGDLYVFDGVKCNKIKGGGATLTIGGKTYNGSTDVTIQPSDITAGKVSNKITIGNKQFDGSSAITIEASDINAIDTDIVHILDITDEESFYEEDLDGCVVFYNGVECDSIKKVQEEKEEEGETVQIPHYVFRFGASTFRDYGWDDETEDYRLISSSTGDTSYIKENFDTDIRERVEELELHSGKTSNKITIGNKQFDGSSAVTIQASDLKQIDGTLVNSIDLTNKSSLVESDFKGKVAFYDGKECDAVHFCTESTTQGGRPVGVSHVVFRFDDAFRDYKLNGTTYQLVEVTGDEKYIKESFNTDHAKRIEDLEEQSGKTLNPLTFGTKTFDGSEAKEITAEDLGISSAFQLLGNAKYEQAMPNVIVCKKLYRGGTCDLTYIPQTDESVYIESLVIESVEHQNIMVYGGNGLKNLGWLIDNGYYDDDTVGVGTIIAATDVDCRGVYMWIETAQDNGAFAKFGENAIISVDLDELPNITGFSNGYAQLYYKFTDDNSKVILDIQHFVGGVRKKDFKIGNVVIAYNSSNEYYYDGHSWMPYGDSGSYALKVNTYTKSEVDAKVITIVNKKSNYLELQNANNETLVGLPAASSSYAGLMNASMFNQLNTNKDNITTLQSSVATIAQKLIWE